MFGQFFLTDNWTPAGGCPIPDDSLTLRFARRLPLTKSRVPLQVSGCGDKCDHTELDPAFGQDRLSSARRWSNSAYRQKDMNALSTEVLLDNLHELLATMPDAERIHSLKARIVPGLGVAQGTLARQLPLISQGFPEVVDCYPGTINMELECPLEVAQPDHRTAPLAWTPSGRTTEVFDLVRIELEFGPLPTRVPAWLYVAHASPHRGTPTVHEVITQQLNLSEVSECQIHLRASAVTLTPTH